MTTTDELLGANGSYAEHHGGSPLPASPARRVAVVACMDARLDVYRLLGLSLGEAHVIRNAGGVVTDDVVRSLLISQRLLGTEEVMLIHHTGCGMTSFTDDGLKEAIERETGLRPAFALEAFADADQDVRQSIARVEASPFLSHAHVRGFVYDLASGRLREIGRAAPAGAAQ